MTLPASRSTPKARLTDYVCAAWRGEEHLWLAYWIYGVVGGNVIGYGFGLLPIDTNPIVGLLVLVAAVAYFIWMNVAIWRCAKNSTVIWSFLARATVVITIAIAPWEFYKGFTGA
jgi:hypothetical protein